MKRPPKNFASLPLTTISENPSALLRVSGYSGGEPYFGKSAANRFDDPDCAFGTCYLGRTILVALAETVLHDEVAVGGTFRIAVDELTRRYVVRFTGPALVLADFTGAPLKAMGLDGSFFHYPFLHQHTALGASHLLPSAERGWISVHVPAHE